MAAIRFALAAVFAIAWIAWRRPRWFLPRDFVVLAISGLLGIAAYNVLLNLGQAAVSAGAAGFIVNTQPLFMVLLAVLFLKERFGRWNWVGTIVGFSGVALIASGQPGGLSFGTGSTLIVLAAACAAAYSILQRPLFARAEPLDVTGARHRCRRSRPHALATGRRLPIDARASGHLADDHVPGRRSGHYRSKLLDLRTQEFRCRAGRSISLFGSTVLCWTGVAPAR